MRTNKIIKALQMERGALFQECRMIIDFATVRNRELTKAEAAKVNRMLGCVNRLDGRICAEFRELDHAAPMWTYAKRK